MLSESAACGRGHRGCGRSRTQVWGVGIGGQPEKREENWCRGCLSQPGRISQHSCSFTLVCACVICRCTPYSASEFLLPEKGFLLETGLGLCCSPPVGLDVACQPPAEGWGQMVFPPRCVGQGPISQGSDGISPSWWTGGRLIRFHPERLRLGGGAPEGNVSLAKLCAVGGRTCCVGAAS